MANSNKIWRIALVEGKRYNWSQKEYSTAGAALRDMAKYVDTFETFNGNIYIAPFAPRSSKQPKEGGAE